MAEAIVSGTGTWTWNTQTALPPATKQLRTNTGDWATATQLYISDIDENNINHAQKLDNLKAGDQIHIEHNTDSTRYVDYIANGTIEAVAAATYHKVGVTLVGTGGTLPSMNTVVRVIGVAPEIPEPEVGQMWINLTMNSAVTDYMVTDLMDDIALNLQTVTHLVDHAEFKANVNGVILTLSVDILPATSGIVAPTESWVATGEQTVNA